MHDALWIFQRTRHECIISQKNNLEECSGKQDQKSHGLFRAKKYNIMNKQTDNMALFSGHKVIIW